MSGFGPRFWSRRIAKHPGLTVILVPDSNTMEDRTPLWRSESPALGIPIALSSFYDKEPCRPVRFDFSSQSFLPQALRLRLQPDESDPLDSVGLALRLLYLLCAASTSRC